MQKDYTQGGTGRQQCHLWVKVSSVAKSKLSCQWLRIAVSFCRQLNTSVPWYGAVHVGKRALWFAGLVVDLNNVGFPALAGLAD